MPYEEGNENDRDYLTEAFRIAAGATLLLPQRAHVDALIAHIRQLEDEAGQRLIRLLSWCCRHSVPGVHPVPIRGFRCLARCQSDCLKSAEQYSQS